MGAAVQAQSQFHEPQNEPGQYDDTHSTHSEEMSLVMPKVQMNLSLGYGRFANTWAPARGQLVGASVVRDLRLAIRCHERDDSIATNIDYENAPLSIFKCDFLAFE